MAKLRTHTCKAVGCQHVISARMLMCIDHWRMVPVATQREIRAAARDGTDAGWQRYLDAVRTAIAQVKEKQDRKASEVAGSSGALFNP